MVKRKIAVTREAFLQLNLPKRLQLWAEDNELEEYILTKAFTYKDIAEKSLQAKGKIKVAIIGSGPSGLGCADVLNKLGFKVTVFERADRPGGLLMYGVPNVKLPKDVLLSKIEKLDEDGVEFRLNAFVGKEVSWEQVRKIYAAVVICTGSSQPRPLKLPGNELAGIYYAKDFLTSTTKGLLDHQLAAGTFISAEDKNVLIIGGGDTGTDCAALALAHGARQILQVEHQDCNMAKISQEGLCEVAKDDASIQYNTKVESLLGADGQNVSGAQLCRVEWGQTSGGMPVAKELNGTAMVFPADMVLVATGFSGPEPIVFEKFGVKKTPMGTIAGISGVFLAAEPGVFAAGDARRGSGMVTWAFAEGYDVAIECAKYLNNRI